MCWETMKDYTDGKIADHKKLIGYFDGGCEPINPGGVCTSAWVIHDANEKLAAQGMVVRDGNNKRGADKLATNNYAEYCALGLLLKFLVDNNWRGEIHIYSDSKLVVNQTTKNWKMKSPTLKPLRDKVWVHLKTLELEVSMPEEEFECFTCDHTGPIDTLIDLDQCHGDSREMLLCPKCSNVVTGFNAPTNCTLEWIRRDKNEEADAIGRQAYQNYMRANK